METSGCVVQNQMISIEQRDEIFFAPIPFPELIELGWTAPGWYFWDNSSFLIYGPYKSEKQAKENQQIYNEV
jgi:hypothetical protein